MNSRLSPFDVFPEDVTTLQDVELQVLHSRIQRQLDYEYAHDYDAHPETVFRAADIAEEFERREVSASSWQPLLRVML